MMLLARRVRQTIGVLIYDWLPFEIRLRRGRWAEIRNRGESVATDGRGVKCLWEFTSDLHIAKVFPGAGARLMNAAFNEHPIELRESPLDSETPEVSFIVGHRGRDRLPNLLMTLRSIAGQHEAPFECIVVEQSAVAECRNQIPSWVRYLHTPVDDSVDYSRARAFNDGAGIARGRLLIFHDNDLVVPATYAREALTRLAEGNQFIDLKRFLFYLDSSQTQRVFDEQLIRTDLRGVLVVQNPQGGSVAVERDAFREVGGFDEEFVGWGGEDNEFWDRAEVLGGCNAFGYLPFVHLYHQPQVGKLQGTEASAVKRYHEQRLIDPKIRIERLRCRRSSSGTGMPLPVPPAEGK